MNRVPRIVLMIVLISAAMGAGRQSQPFDLVISGGTVVDGTGGERYQADVGVIGDRIAAVGELDRAEAVRRIDASGYIVAPGFIDIHTHVDQAIFRLPEARNFILQGITTVIGGNCGGPLLDVGAFLARLDGLDLATNIAVYVGHNAVRARVMGVEARQPTAEELEQMRTLVENAMKDGAIGLSTGLNYSPGMFSETEELIALNRVVGEYGGLYASHLRDQDIGIFPAVEEAIRVGREGGTRVQLSHLKFSIDEFWGETERLHGIIQAAWNEGLEVYADAYPYVAGATALSINFPDWSMAGGRLQRNLGDPETRARIKEELFTFGPMMTYRNRDMLSALQILTCPADPGLNGKTLRQILEERGLEPDRAHAAELVMEIQSGGGARCLYFVMDQKDVDDIIRLPYTMIASDGGIGTQSDQAHPRAYGTFPRILGDYVRERALLDLETAIHKMTALPARSLRFEHRGILREGNFADLIVFDPETVRDTATYAEPHQYPEGIRTVVVNGVVTVENGELTEGRGGRPLYGPGRITETDSPPGH